MGKGDGSIEAGSVPAGASAAAAARSYQRKPTCFLNLGALDHYPFPPTLLPPFGSPLQEGSAESEYLRFASARQRESMWGENSTFDASGSSSSSSPSSSTSASLRDGSGGSGGGDAMLRSLRRNQHWKLTDRPGVDLMAAGSDVLRETGQVRKNLEEGESVAGVDLMAAGSDVRAGEAGPGGGGGRYGGWYRGEAGRVGPGLGGGADGV